MYETKEVRHTIEELKSSLSGLTQEEAQKRSVEYGANELTEEKQESLLSSFLSQLNDPLICVLLIAATISIFLGEVNDAIIIMIVVVVNGIVGVIQEGKARKALESLKKLSSPKAVVKRQAQWTEIDSSKLTIGDLVRLDAGRQVPADLRLIESQNLKIEESALTGEALPVQKNADMVIKNNASIGDRKNMAYMSTIVTAGRGEGIVCNIGMKTEIGKIAAMIQNTEKELTPLQKRLADLGKILTIVSVLLCVALFGVAMIQQRNIPEMLLTAISLAVAAVPEGLPAVVTIVLALGVSKMVRIHTIIRKLPSVETLGCVNVVCSDKTGTLTQNKMTVQTCYIDQRMYEAQRLDKQYHVNFLEAMTLCNDARIEGDNVIGDPTEAALLRLSSAYSIHQEQLQSRKKRVGERAFDSQRKMMSTLHQATGKGYITYTKGAPDVLLEHCTSILSKGKISPLTSTEKHKINDAIQLLSDQALRVLAIAMREQDSRMKEEQMVFLGLVGMMDPPRQEAKAAVDTFAQAGVRTVMITGDHKDTAHAIAKELGIAEEKNQCMTGSELERISDEELKRKLPALHVFARVSPEHKVRIVKALKEEGNIVAMTGDGVNDAPSLQIADIGIAMGASGTDVAKNASDMILMDDNFATIEKAIEEGRGIYENIKKSVLFLLSSNFGEIITMFLAVLAGLVTPLKSSHILWINLITDSLPALALGVDVNDKKALMKKPPRKAKESLFAQGGIQCTVFYGMLIAALSLTAFFKVPWDLLREAGTPWSLEHIKQLLNTEIILTRAQTYAFTVLGVSQLFHAIGMRDTKCSIFKMKHFNNKWMILAFVIGLGLQVMVTEIPYLIHAFGTVALSMQEWGSLLVLSAFPLLAHEMIVLLQQGNRKKSMSGLS